MDVVSGSVLCQRFLSFGEMLSRAWGGCVLGRLFAVLLLAYDGSALARFNRRAAQVWTRWWRDSVIVHVLFHREGLLPRTWAESHTCQILSFLINLPVALLHWIYLKLLPWFERSFLAPFVFGVGEQVPIAMGWMMLLFMNIDYWKWSNGYSFLGFVFLLLLFCPGAMRRRSLRLDVAGVGFYLTLFFAAVCLSWPLSRYPELSGRYLYYHITCALCVLLTVSTVERVEQLERLTLFGCLGLTGVSAYAVFQRTQGVVVIPAYVDMDLNPDMPGRVFSFYVNPNAFAELLVMLIPVAVGLMLGSKKPFNRFIGFLSSVLGCAALIMTYCRASWVGFALAAMVFLFFWKRKLVPMCIVAGLAALPLLPKAVLQRVLTIFNPNDSSTASRLPLMQAGLRIIKAHPILGAGLGGDAVRQMSNDLHTYTATYARFTHSHNLYIQLWLEHGLAGVLSFVAGCWHMLKRGGRAVQMSGVSRPVRFIVLGALSSLVGSLVSGLADYIFNYPRVMLIFWFAFSLLMAGVKLADREQARRAV